MKNNNVIRFYPLENSNASIITGTPLKDTPGWSAARSRFLCCSEVSHLLGLEPAHSRGQVLAEKAGQPPKPMNAVGASFVAWGKAMEGAAIQDASREFSQFFGPLVTLGSLVHNMYAILQGEPDAVMLDPMTGKYIPVEIKCRCYPEPKLAIPYESPYDVPLKHWVQVQLYMELLNSDWGLLFNWTIYNGYSYFWVARDRVLFNEFVVPLMEQFRNGTLPKRVDSKQKTALLAHMQQFLDEGFC